MANILLSIWVQLGSLFFLLAGLNHDLLIIRLFLYLAYLMLLINALLGSPLWPNLMNMDEFSSQNMATDSLIWASVSLYVHASSLIALIWDEREPKLTEDQAALWRLMYRTGGLSARLFQDIVARHLNVIQVAAGDQIDTSNYFYVLYTGRIDLEVLEDGSISHSRVLYSGEMFNLKSLGLVSKQSYFDEASIRCTALCDSKLFQIRIDDLSTIFQNPLSKSIFQALLINNLMYVVESFRELNRRSRQPDQLRNKLFDPLEPWEEPDASKAGSGKALQYPFRHIWNGIVGSFGLPWPFARHRVGLRQTQLRPPPKQEEIHKTKLK